ncbi:MAG: DUF1501 domain-containing protein [Planctomycetota bacterium]|nr:DUF1501 domain-containing protein [Planctomycetota bacterium]MDA1178120.1 DUF1501 domain-containing protein [Planctomycetota bacterium]
MTSEAQHLTARRQFLGRSSLGLGAVALSQLFSPAASPVFASQPSAGTLAQTHFAPRARRVIYLFMSGGPAQMELFDHKPKLREMHAQELPPSVIGTQRLTTMTRQQKAFPIAGSKFSFARQGDQDLEVSELLPHTASVVNHLAVIRSMHTEPINHDPAVMFLQSGSNLAGRPCMGSWLSYGLGAEDANLPAFVVLLSGNTRGGQPLLSKYWHSGFLPGRHQGVQFRSAGDPVMNLTDPPGVSRANRRDIVDAVNQINALKLESQGDPEIEARINAFELAFRMQSTVPELTDLTREPQHVLDLYGAEPGRASFANNCLLARRMIERGVKFVQLYDRDWDHHQNIPEGLPTKCKETDKATAALIHDLAQRGLLEDTLVIWGGEFGRTTYCQGTLTADTYGRDHHPRCFTMWLAGGGIKPGIVLGKTDDFSYNIAEDPIHVHDLQATILHCLGVDHERMTYRYQGRDFRLTDVGGKVITKLLA